MFSQTLAVGSLSLYQFKDLTQCIILPVCMETETTVVDLTDSLWTLVTQSLKVSLAKKKKKK